MGRIVIEPPYPKQIEFFKATSRYVAYGGARGGGKSWAARTKAVLLALNYPGIQILLLRRQLTELRENHVIPLMRLLRDIAPYRQQEKTFVFPNGSRIVLGYCSAESDVLQYQGQSYDVIFMEEATQFSEFQFQTLTESNRSSGLCEKAFPPRMYFTCNPGGVGHEWVKRLFIDKIYRNSERPEDYTFIKSLVYDNKFIMEHSPEYVRTLENLPEDRRRAMLYGDWDVFAGQYFPEFSREKHVIDPFPVPEDWRIYRAMDYGLDMLAVVWIAVDTTGRAYVIRELAMPDMPISDAAKKILELSPEEAYLTWAPPDLWARSQESGKSKADLFVSSSLAMTKSNNNREAGWLAVKELLKDGPDGEPRLLIFSNCKELIHCIPALQHDEKKPTDCATQPHEITHLPDALRYFAVQWARPAREVQKKTQLQKYREKVLRQKDTRRSYY